MRRILWILSLASMCVAGRAVGAPSADYCAAVETLGVYNVQCYGADPAVGNNDTDAVYRAWCHVLRQDQGVKRAKTIYFPAGEYAINFPLGFDLNWHDLDALTLQGDGMDASKLLKDPSLAGPGGTWSVVNSNWTNSLDPSYCYGDYVYSWTHSGAGDDHAAHHAVWISTSTAAPNTVDFTMAGLTLARATRVYPTNWYDDVAVYFVSPGTATFSGSRVTSFYLGYRTDFVPGNSSSVNNRPQKFVSRNSAWEDLAMGPNGDGTFTVTGSTFRRNGITVSPYGHSVYFKRMMAFTFTGNRIEAPIGHGITLLNDHDGSDPPWDLVGEPITITDNVIEGVHARYSLYTDLNNQHANITIDRNTFTTDGTFWLSGGFDGVSVRDNTFAGVQVCFQTCDPSSPDKLRARPTISGNRFYGGSIGAALQDAVVVGNSLFGAPMIQASLNFPRSTVFNNVVSSSAVAPVIGTVKLLTFDGSSWRE